MLLTWHAFAAGNEWKDLSLHREGFVSAHGVKLHYLDWGGKGETILFLAGLGGSAHIFDDLAPEFTNEFRTVALTRRGFGQSDKPVTGYDATTLVKDIVALLDALHLENVILAGHSVAGQEMTRMAVDFPDRISKLVYLDAAYDYSVGVETILRFQELSPRPSAEDESSFASLLRWNRDHRPGWNSACEIDFRATRLPDGGGYSAKDSSPEAAVQEVVQALILSAPPDFRKVNAPALAIFADNDVAGYIAKAEETQRDRTREIVESLMKWQRAQAGLFGERVKGARVIELSGTDHFCFIHKQAKVVQEMRHFLKGD